MSGRLPVHVNVENRPVSQNGGVDLRMTTLPEKLKQAKCGLTPHTHTHTHMYAHTRTHAHTRSALADTGLKGVLPAMQLFHVYGREVACGGLRYAAAKAVPAHVDTITHADKRLPSRLPTPSPFLPFLSSLPCTPSAVGQLPIMRGFDYSIGYLNGEETHYSHFFSQLNAYDFWENDAPARGAVVVLFCCFCSCLSVCVSVSAIPCRKAASPRCCAAPLLLQRL